MERLNKDKPTLAITLGDPSGIGPEVTVKALQHPDLVKNFHPIVVGHRPSFLGAIQRWGQQFKQTAPDEFQIRRFKVQYVEVASEITAEVPIGQTSKEGGIIAAAALREAGTLALQGLVDAVVTSPVNKEALHRVGLTYPGQTEFLAELAGTPVFAMMLVGHKIRVVMVTTHIPLAKVAKSLTPAAIVEKIEVTYLALKHLFGIAAPRIAVCALNPHAGDGGCFGNEEATIIEPAIAIVRRKGINAVGPLPADSLFPRMLKGEFDAAVAMYHDQGIIPVKLESFGRGVNITLGLPFIRTSVDHGTAYDIAGQGQADADSMIEAIHMACDLVQKKKKIDYNPQG